MRSWVARARALVLGLFLVFGITFVGMLALSALLEPTHERLARRLIRSIDSITEVMEGIHDRESAELAVPELRRRAEEFEAAFVAVDELLKQSPPTAEKDLRLRLQFTGPIRESALRTRTQAERLNAIPDVAPVIRETMEEIAQRVKIRLAAGGFADAPSVPTAGPAASPPSASPTRSRSSGRRAAVLSSTSPAANPPSASPIPIQATHAATHSELLAFESFQYEPIGATLVGGDGGHGFKGPWSPGGFNARHHNQYRITGGSPGLSADAEDRHVRAGALPAIGGLTRTLRTPLGTPGTTRYLSLLLRPEERLHAGSLNGFFGLYLNASTRNDLFVGKPGHGAADRYVMEDRGSNRQHASKVEPAVGVSVRLVLRADFADGPDKFTLYVSPPPGREPSNGVVKRDSDVGSVDALTIYSTGAFSIDDIRIGDTYADVVPAAGDLPEPVLATAPPALRRSTPEPITTIGLDATGRSYLIATVVALAGAIIAFYIISKKGSRAAVLLTGSALLFVGQAIPTLMVRELYLLKGVLRLTGFIGIVLGVVDFIRRRDR